MLFSAFVQRIKIDLELQRSDVRRGFDVVLVFFGSLDKTHKSIEELFHTIIW